MANVKIVFESGHETVVSLPDATGARLVRSFAKFTEDGDAPAARFKVDEDSSLSLDWRKVAMVMNGAPSSP
ncbi:MAG: hypothetical protein LAT81_02590 [Oceanicaulis sp.]|nr:hypothetical protein [Oceanicaulis sp.]